MDTANTFMLLGAVVVIAYTAVGGFLAESASDLMQGIIMSIALLAILIFTLDRAGGPGAVIGRAGALPGYLSLIWSCDAFSAPHRSPKPSFFAWRGF